ncbi:MAG: hypothetical protein AB7T03_05475 [Bacilli bacterium]
MFFRVKNDPITFVPATAFPAATFFIIFLIAAILLYVFFTLNKQEQYIKITTIFQNILASAFFFWGLILFFATVKEGNKVGVKVLISSGFFVLLFYLVLLWLLFILKSKSMQLMYKHIINSSKTKTETITPAEEQIENKKHGAKWKLLKKSIITT